MVVQSAHGPRNLGRAIPHDRQSQVRAPSRGRLGPRARRCISKPASSWSKVTPMNCFCRIQRAMLALLIVLGSVSLGAQDRWTEERANTWWAHERWPVGANFVPSTAINELEMWQAETYDRGTIDRELGWAEAIGMNTMRVFLHNLLWE